jgi:hypothetical protein
LAQPQDLHKQSTEGIEIAAAKLADSAVVWLLIARQHPKGQILGTSPLVLSGGGDADAVGV